MASPAVLAPSSPRRSRTAPAKGGGSEKPDIDEWEYRVEVLHLTDSQSEAEIDSKLAARAAALGISSAADAAAAAAASSSSSSSSSRPVTAPAAATSADASRAESAITVVTRGHARSFSTRSDTTADTALTSHSSLRETAEAPAARADRRRETRLSFSQYDAYLGQIGMDELAQAPAFEKAALASSVSVPSLYSAKSGKGYGAFRRSLDLKARWRRKRSSAVDERKSMSCVACRDEFKFDQALRRLPCRHTYCSKCLHTKITQSWTDESKMPPRCCNQPIPSSTVKSVLSRTEEAQFLRAIIQFSVPWESRMFCPNADCSAFIPPRSIIDPKHPHSVACPECETQVCIACQQEAHPPGQSCPSDWEVEAVLDLGSMTGWRRCYNCRSLVEPISQACTHLTCRCKAQFCYTCGAVWDEEAGCPNSCNGEEEERRRLEDAARAAELEAIRQEEEEAAAVAAEERRQADERTAASVEFQALRADQEQEMERFLMFERKTKWIQWSRHAQTKTALVDDFAARLAKMEERHLKTPQLLEDRQIIVEMELRANLEQSERSMRIRLKHMEAYCEALGRGRGGTDDGGDGSAAMPARTVTERDLRELGQQYNLRDGMERLHQAKINVLRDQQAKRMEDLLERQAGEMRRLLGERARAVRDLEADFVQDEEALSRLFEGRRGGLVRRWELAAEIMRKEMEQERGAAYGPMGLPAWPAVVDEVFDERGVDDVVTPDVAAVVGRGGGADGGMI